MGHWLIQLPRLLKLGLRFGQKLGSALGKIGLPEQQVHRCRAGFESRSPGQFPDRGVQALFLNQFQGAVHESCVLGNRSSLGQAGDQDNGGAHNGIVPALAGGTGSPAPGSDQRLRKTTQ